MSSYLLIEKVLKMNIYRKLAFSLLIGVVGVISASEINSDRVKNNSVTAVDQIEDTSSSESGFAGQMAAFALFAMVHDKLKYERLLKQLCRYIEQGDLEIFTYVIGKKRAKNGISSVMKESLLAAAVKARDHAGKNMELKKSLPDCAKLFGGSSLLLGTGVYFYSIFSENSTKGASLKPTERFMLHTIALYSLYKGISFIEKGWNCTHAQKRYKNAQAVEEFIKALPVVE